MFEAKIYHILDLNHFLKSLSTLQCKFYLQCVWADYHMGIIDDHQVLVQPQVDIREYGSVTDKQLATSFLFKEQDL